MRTKLILPLFALVFLLSSVNPKIELQKSRQVYIDHSELKNDSIRMRINKVKLEASKAFEKTLMQRDTIKDLTTLK
ncbi:hypothetical protein [Flavobacterium sp.]|uniref:hypothetical protein n=1 Tax=Flavobacterium sp. TaxID=239 RepID=UPI002619D94F|nr:hypothetical protein [Flavobacterium sp.]